MAFVDRPEQRRDCLLGCGQLRPQWQRLVQADLESAVETVIQDLLAGEYRKPIRVVAFNTAERCSEDVSEDIAREIQRRCNLHLSDVPSYLQELVDRYSPQDLQQFSLRLV